MNIAIIGFGFVGKALYNGLIDNSDVYLIDPMLNTSIIDLKDVNPELIFICVPTPVSSDGLSQDTSILEKVITDINNLNLSSSIVIKSTVLPDKLVELNALRDIIYNPEFLRERTADYDFIHSDLIIIGGNKESGKKLGLFYDLHTKCKCKQYIYTDIVAASFIKYTINSFLASKVLFFNELQALYNSSGTKVPWEEFIKIISIDKRIGDSHMNVPGHDGRLGFGGACLPKDSLAFFQYSTKQKKPLNLLEKVIKLNKLIRSKYKSLTEREKVQNIKYKGD
jgi:UDPglucose 6-dehydrogenase